MLSPKALICLAILYLVLLLADAKGNKGGSGGRAGPGRRRSFFSTDNIWFYTYHFSDSNFKPTPMSMAEFAQENIRIMWENRPAHAMAATCINSPWSVKDYDKVSPAIRVSYFVKPSFWHPSKKVRMFDCLYIWGPDQQFYSWDDVTGDQMSYSIDGEKCTMDNKTMDLTCL